jgi:hypothetical protein
VVLLLEGVVVSWSLAMDERGGYEDLRALGHWSVIPYVHGKTELYCSGLPCLSQPFVRPCEEVPDQTFYSSSLGSYIETRGLTDDPEVFETLYSI